MAATAQVLRALQPSRTKRNGPSRPSAQQRVSAAGVVEQPPGCRHRGDERHRVSLSTAPATCSVGSISSAACSLAQLNVPGWAWPARAGEAAAMCAGLWRHLSRITPKPVQASQGTWKAQQRRQQFSGLRSSFDIGFSRATSGRHDLPAVQSPWPEKHNFVPARGHEI
eukprot:4521833-Prymnesium_polylepis.2